MNGSSAASEFSSGFESGWTMYLDHSSASHPNYSYQQHKPDQFVDEEEEDLSMVSDASSGPQVLHFHEQADYCPASSSVPTLMMNKNIKRQKTDQQQQQQQQQQQKQSSLLDDTAASSHVLSFSKNHLKITKKQAPIENALDFSRQTLETHLNKEKHQKRYALQKNYGFFTSVTRNPTPAEPVVCRKNDRSNIW